MDASFSYMAIEQACDSWFSDPDPQCRKTQIEQGGRLAGSVAGGGFGGFAGTYIACNVIFGVPTGGSSLLWCGIGGAVVGGYAGSRYISSLSFSVGKKIGNLLYENEH